jgi:hypothetical protein
MIARPRKPNAISTTSCSSIAADIGRVAYLITSSARLSTEIGNVSPSAHRSLSRKCGARRALQNSSAFLRHTP